MFTPFEHTPDNVQQCFDRIDFINRRDFSGSERFVARPATSKEKKKPAIRSELANERLKSLVTEAETLYRDFLSFM